MAFSVTPTSGINFSQVYATVADATIGPLGLEVFGSDGKIYVLAKANAAIPASTAVCSIDPANFNVTATGGAYASPATALVSGNVAWFGKASV